MAGKSSLKIILFLAASIILGTIAVIVVCSLLFVAINKTISANIIHMVKPNPAVSDGPLPPKPTSPYDPFWYKKSPIYQIYPRSFQDSDGDGTGDLRGIIARLDYLVSIGIENVWLNPIYQSPMKDFGYDISNFTRIDPLFGSIQDFDDLISAMHARGMKLIMDFVPNHSSDQNLWFKYSVKNITPYNDFYVWRNQPNNWNSVFGNSSWEWSEDRQQYYLHQYLIAQPDLNYRSSKLQQKMIDVLKFWLKHQVDGFRIDAIIHLVEDRQFRDNPWNPRWNGPKNDYNAQIHKYNINQNMTYNVTASWVQLFRSMGHQMGKHIFSVVEAGANLKYTMEYYSTGVDFPFNFYFTNTLDMTKDAIFLKEGVDYWMASTPAGGWPNWVLSRHDVHRISTRMGGRQYTDVINMFLLLLPGTPVCYYGDEIGMVDVFVPYNQTKDPAGKKWGPVLYLNKTSDPERTPMQWSSEQNAGFSSSKNGTWLPIAPDFQSVNVEVQMLHPWSHLNIFKKLMALRLQPTFINSATNIQTFTDQITNDVLIFTRPSSTAKSYIIFLNVGHHHRNTTFNVSATMLNTRSNVVGTIEMRTGNVNVYRVGQKILLKSLTLSDAQGIVVSYYNFFKKQISDKQRH